MPSVEINLESVRVMVGIRFEESCAQKDPEWDAFVASCENPHIEQTSLWGSLQRHNGWQALRLYARKGSELIGGVQLLEKKITPFAKAGYLKRGPIIAPGEPCAGAEMIRQIKALGKKRNLTYLAIVLPYAAGSLEAELLQAGFSVRPDFLPPQNKMMSTIALDLCGSPEELLAGMRTSTRTQVRQGQKRGLTVRDGNRQDLETFSRLLLELCQRRGVRPNIPTGEFITEFWDAFSPTGTAKLFIAQMQHEPVNALMLVVMKPWARVWRVGWSGRHSEARPNVFIHWEAIKWARDNGIRYFDFDGFDRKAACAIAGGRQVPENEMCSVSAFKFGFRGTVMPLQPDYCFFFNPVIREIFTGARKLASLAAANENADR